MNAELRRSAKKIAAARLKRQGRPTSLGDRLVRAAHEGRLDKVRDYLAAGVDVNALDKTGHDTCGRTALMASARFAHADIAVALLEKGADPNVVSQNRWWPGTALHDAAGGFWTADRNRFVQLLLRAGAEVNAQDTRGGTPLMRAVFDFSSDSRQIEHALAVIRQLLDAGADRQLRDHAGKTVLDFVQESARPYITQLLTES